jgi:glycine/D-amino acid oxidase-like deaminating enzyme
MKLAIIGAGYAGMALALFALERNFSVTVFDDDHSASKVSTGLLHSCPGKKAIPSKRAEEGMAASLELLEIASRKRPVYERNGILRFAIDEYQENLFGGKTLWMPDAITVYSDIYLEELKKICHQAKFEKRRIEKLDLFDDFDAIIVAAGAGSVFFADLPVKKTIGQCLLCKWSRKLPMSLLGSGHITPTANPKLCLVGSTYEHTSEPNPQEALKLIDKVSQFYPPAKNFEVVEIRSAIRLSPKIGYDPIVKKIDDRTWVFTAFGSRGLLYHALLAKELISQL